MSGGFITLHAFFALQKMFSELIVLIHNPRKQSHRGIRTRSTALANLCAHHWTTGAPAIFAKVQCYPVRLPLCSESQSQKSSEVGFEPGPLRLHTRALTNGLYRLLEQCQQLEPIQYTDLDLIPILVSSSSRKR